MPNTVTEQLGTGVPGHVFDIQRFSVHDGPGIRTTVFLKGCPLNCAWCHNPEGIRNLASLSFSEMDCAGCGQCADACPGNLHRVEQGRHTIDRSLCTQCGECARTCPGKALELVGKNMSANDVLDEIEKDVPFYEASGGGVTLSGGEPMAQPDFAHEVLRLCKTAGIHTVLETCGFCSRKQLEKILSLVDLFLFDVKETDPARHLEFTGVPPALITANLEFLCAHKANILLRCPIVPGLNDRNDHFDGLAELAGRYPVLTGIELMPFHKLGQGKQARFGLSEGKCANTEPPSDQTVADWVGYLRTKGVNVFNDIETSYRKGVPNAEH